MGQYHMLFQKIIGCIVLCSTCLLVLKSTYVTIEFTSSSSSSSSSFYNQNNMITYIEENVVVPPPVSSIFPSTETATTTSSTASSKNNYTTAMATPMIQETSWSSSWNNSNRSTTTPMAWKKKNNSKNNQNNRSKNNNLTTTTTTTTKKDSDDDNDFDLVFLTVVSMQRSASTTFTDDILSKSLLQQHHHQQQQQPCFYYVSLGELYNLSPNQGTSYLWKNISMGKQRNQPPQQQRRQKYLNAKSVTYPSDLIVVAKRYAQQLCHQKRKQQQLKQQSSSSSISTTNSYNQCHHHNKNTTTPTTTTSSSPICFVGMKQFPQHLTKQQHLYIWNHLPNVTMIVLERNVTERWKSIFVTARDNDWTTNGTKQHKLKLQQLLKEVIIGERGVGVGKGGGGSSKRSTSASTPPNSIPFIPLHQSHVACQLSGTIGLRLRLRQHCDFERTHKQWYQWIRKHQQLRQQLKVQQQNWNSNATSSSSSISITYHDVIQDNGRKAIEKVQIGLSMKFPNLVSSFLSSSSSPLYPPPHKSIGNSTGISR